MIGYICKYTPVELIEAFGEKTVKIEPKGKSQERALACTHVNMCSFMKGALEQILEENIRELVLVNCCDSIRRLYDILKDKTDFLHLIDLPRKSSDESCRLFYREISSFAEAFARYKGATLQIDRLKEMMRSGRKEPFPDKKSLLILGAKFDENLLKKIESRHQIKFVNLTCSDNCRPAGITAEKNFLFAYARALLDSFPCMRMASDRQALLQNLPVKGIIYNTIKFCDFYSFEYAALKKRLHVPILKVETDHTDLPNDQLMNRIDAFLEMLETKTPPSTARKDRFFAGIDSGSTSTNAVIIDAGKRILSYANVTTGARALESAEKAFYLALEKAGLTKKDISFTVATGYGRISIPFADRSTTEISCHGKGAFSLDKDVRTIIDIGGQDSKVISLDEKGNVLDFVMNDKCAAGTGRFLDFMARALEISIEDISEVILDFKEDVVITSMCTVFAESEVISLIAHNTEKKDIIRGLNKSVASKTVTLLNRIRHRGKYMMTGGVAKNKGVIYELEKKIGEKIIVPFEPQITGALGAAIIAAESTS